MPGNFVNPFPFCASSITSPTTSSVTSSTPSSTTSSPRPRSALYPVLRPFPTNGKPVRTPAPKSTSIAVSTGVIPSAPSLPTSFSKCCRGRDPAAPYVPPRAPNFAYFFRATVFAACLDTFSTTSFDIAPVAFIPPCLVASSIASFE